MKRAAFVSTLSASTLALTAPALAVHRASGDDDPTAHFDPTRAIGMKATTVDGTEFVLQAHHGKPVLLNFFATWCVACAVETPELVRLAEAYRDRVVIVGIDYGEKRADVRAFRDRFRVTYPLVLDPQGTFYGAIGARALPSNLLVDEKGRVVRAFAGTRPPATYRAVFDALLAGDVGTARRLSAT